MTHERDFDRIAQAWLETGPGQAPDRTVAAVLTAIETAPQVRRPFRWTPGRQIHMSPRTFALVGALTLALVIGGSLITGSQSQIAQPTQSPSPVPSGLYQSLIGQWAGAPRVVTELGRSDIVRATFAAAGRWDFSGTTVPSNRFRSDVAVTAPGRLTLTTTAASNRCQLGDVGSYRYELSPGNKRLTLSAETDTCAERIAAAEGDWVRNDCQTGSGIAGGDWDCYGDLEAGTYKSREVDLRDEIVEGRTVPIAYGALTFTVPDGWTHVADNATRFWLMPSAQYGRVHDGVPLDGLWVFGHPQAASQADVFPFEPQPGVGLTPSDLMSFITSLPGVKTSNVQDVSINGRTGARVDIQLDPSWKKTCPWHGDDPIKPFLYVNTGVDGADLSTRLRMVFLDIGHGDTVAVEIAGVDPARWDALLAEAMPIVESFVFAEPGTTP